MSRTTFTEAVLYFLARMRVARLATVDATGQPHVVPIVFATDGHYLYTPLDEKPKRVEPRQLKRVRNIVANPRVAVVVDEYDEDWTRLGWVLINGTAEISESGESHAVGLQLLQEKYLQYRSMHLERRPIIVVMPTRVTSWGSLRA
jgi:PPOX class probable F420-dependent enzyme